jgi:biotin-(acetyl-CoA carboxylase) ligase
MTYAEAEKLIGQQVRVNNDDEWYTPGILTGLTEDGKGIVLVRDKKGQDLAILYCYLPKVDPDTPKSDESV